MKYDHITQLIGNTPLLRIDPSVHGLTHIDVYAKLEYWNPFGSVKDRIAWAMLRDDISDIQKTGKTVLESSSGNTAKALHLLCSMYDIPFKTITNRINVDDVRSILTALGVTIEELPGRSECPDPSDPDNPLAVIERLMASEQNNYFHTSQYTNQKNVQMHYDTTGAELLADLECIDYFVGGLGTTGSTLGTLQRIKGRDSQLTSIGVVAANGEHIPGIRTESELFEVGLFKREEYRAIEKVSAKESIDGMLTLVKQCGILAGPTSGGTYVGLLKALREEDAALKERKTAVFIACDRMEWYMSYIRKYRPDLFNASVSAAPEEITEEELEQAPVVDIAEAQDLLNNPNTLAIDTRSNGAYRAGHISGSINIPQNLLTDIINGGKPFPPDKTMLLICPIGEQSRTLVAKLHKSGYKAFSLKGGIIEWRDAGKSLERTPLQT